MSKRILLVEDDKFLYDLYKRVLTDIGYEVDVAVDGEDGLNKATQNKYDLILLDIMMPKKSGVELLLELKAASSPSREIPIVMMSNLGQDDVINQCLSAGAAGFLIKAQNLPQDIVSRVKEFLGE